MPKKHAKQPRQIREPRQEIQISAISPGKLRRVWIWIGSWSVWIWIKHKADEASLADWAMVFFTFVLAATTIVFTVYAKRQWQEMKSGGEDTKALAKAAGEQAGAAGKQADRMKDFADRMKEQADQTKIIAEQAVVQAKAAQIAANASSGQVEKLEAGVEETHALAEQARRAAKTSEDGLKLSTDVFHAQQRPWLYVKENMIRALRPVDLAGGFTFVGYSIRNSGSAPAVNTNVTINLKIGTPDPPCRDKGKLEASTALNGGFYPTGDFEERQQFVLTQLFRPPINIGDLSGNMVRVALEVCIAYRGQFNEPHLFGGYWLYTKRSSGYMVDPNGDTSFPAGTVLNGGNWEYYPRNSIAY